MNMEGGGKPSPSILLGSGCYHSAEVAPKQIGKTPMVWQRKTGEEPATCMVGDRDYPGHHLGSLSTFRA